MPEPSDTDLSAFTEQELLDHQLENRQPRFFRAGQGKAKGRTGAADIGTFIENLALLQDCSVRMGNQLEMDAVSHCVVYETDSTIAYRYDSDSNPRRPTVHGAMVNRQMPIRELLSELAEL